MIKNNYPRIPLGNKLNYSDHIKHYITDAEVSDYFSQGKVEEQSIRRRYQFFRSILSFKKDDKFCEIGSGGGEALSILKTSKAVYYPVDLSHKNLKTILQKSETATLPTISDIINLPFKNRAFDKMVISEVLEHLEHPIEALIEIYRVLKPEGVAVVTVPYKEKISYHLCIHCNQLTPGNAHLHSFDKNILSGMSNDAGFRIKRILTFGNKLGQLMKINLPLKFLPFFGWRFVEFLLNIFVPKKSHLMIVLSKD